MQAGPHSAQGFVGQAACPSGSEGRSQSGGWRAGLVGAVDHVAGPGFVGDFDADGGAGASLGDGLVVYLHGADVGDEVGGVASDVDVLAEGEGVGELDGGDSSSAEVVGDLADGPFL